jgi:hypothetical protein
MMYVYFQQIQNPLNIISEVLHNLVPAAVPEAMSFNSHATLGHRLSKPGPQKVVWVSSSHLISLVWPKLTKSMEMGPS